MESAGPFSCPASQEITLNAGHTPRSRVLSERNAKHNALPKRDPDENRSPSTLPRSYQGMLKTTTETGDIGMFSIKPSRIPQALNSSSPRGPTATYHEDQYRPRLDFQPYGVPVVDDRRRLPSYARDAASDILSMYDQNSQISGNQVSDHPDYRSYSMTQTSFPSYELSNHRSCASLRNQSDITGRLQRPRSPFAYPTRLRRPGFRPSSPALTDGGIVDYRRRAGIDRLPSGTNQSQSSSSSFYTQKRRPHLLRSEGNRSTPSLLSQGSPSRRSPSPNIRQGTGNYGEWPRRSTQNSVTTSPARSTLSLASTANIYGNAGANSATTTPGKLHPPSPLYYDYTEDFDNDDYIKVEATASSSSLFVKGTSLEDPRRKLGKSNVAPTMERDLDCCVRSSTSAISVIRTCPEDSPGLTGKASRPIEAAIPPLSKDVEDSEDIHDSYVPNAVHGTKVIRLSGFGYGARELSTHVEEALGLLSSPSFEVRIPKGGDTHFNRVKIAPGHDQDQKDCELQSANPSAQDTKLSKPKSHGISQNSEVHSPDKLTVSISQQESTEHSSSTRVRHGSRTTEVTLQEPSQNSCRSSGNLGLPEKESTGDRSRGLDFSKVRVIPTAGSGPHVNINQFASDPEVLCKGVLPSQQSTSPLAIDEQSLRDEIAPVYRGNTTRSVSTDIRAALHASTSQDYLQQRVQQHPYNYSLTSAPVNFESVSQDKQGFAQWFPKNTVSRSSSPLLAPKPISPARQLRLKNSVPQLMKALPPLPLDPSVQTVSPRKDAGFCGAESSYQMWPIEIEDSLCKRQSVILIPSQGATARNSNEDTRVVNSEAREETKTSDIFPQIEESTEKFAAISPTAQKLKLKSRASATSPKVSSDSDEQHCEDGYAWTGLATCTDTLPPVKYQQSRDLKPRFRLRVTRASNSSSGTIRIHRESEESRSLPNLQFHNTKDLFSSTSGFDNVIRRAGRHILFQGVNQSPFIDESYCPISTLISRHTVRPATANENFSNNQDLEMMPNLQSSPSRDRSAFSDTSSHLNVRSRLRTRLSNLRNRMSVPYNSRTVAISLIDINWNKQHSAETIDTSAGTFTPGTASTTVGMTERVSTVREHARKLKCRLRRWLREARFAIRYKASNLSEKSGDERAQFASTV